jgi:aspartate-semialdehyde dehydrogenase
MVGSVLMQRMHAERDFALIEPVFFSTSRVGQMGPFVGKESAPLKDAKSVKELAAMDIVVSCQGGDYTNEVFPRLRSSGWTGYWIDAASALRMRSDAVIILDPVNLDLIKDALSRGVRNYIGGNCTVSLMLMGMHGLLKADLVEWATAMTYQAASGAGAEHMRELVRQMGFTHQAAKPALDDPAGAILEVDRAVTSALRECARRQPAALDRQRPRQRPESRGMEGAGRGQQDSRPRGSPDPDRRRLCARRRHALPQPGAHREAQARPSRR